VCQFSVQKAKRRADCRHISVVQRTMLLRNAFRLITNVWMTTDDDVAAAADAADAVVQRVE